MQARDDVAEPDEPAQKTSLINVAVENCNASAAKEIALAPVVKTLLIELWRNIPIEGHGVCLNAGHAELPNDIIIGWQEPETGQLEAVQLDMMAIKVDHIDSCRFFRKVSQHIAATRTDRHHFVMGLDIHRFHINRGILPDLGIDQSGKQKTKQTLRETRAR